MKLKTIAKEVVYFLFALVLFRVAVTSVYYLLLFLGVSESILYDLNLFFVISYIAFIYYYVKSRKK